MSNIENSSIFLLAETEAFEPGKTILYLLIHLMESKGMVIILHSTRGG